MERFLERVSLSKYRNNFILKGGMLVASLVGVDMRATMDIDTTVKALPLNEFDAERIISEICAVPLEDGVTFCITSVTNNTETLLAEKLQTILVRGIANTQLRDYYDVYSILKTSADKINKMVLKEAFYATCEKRETIFSEEKMKDTLAKIATDKTFAQMWEQFRKKNFFVGDLDWDEVLLEVSKTMDVYNIYNSFSEDKK